MTFEIINYCWIIIAFAVLVVLIGFNIRAPYGRHATKEWGPMIDNKCTSFLYPYHIVALLSNS